MKEVIRIGATPEGAPPAVKEWCINSAVVDPFTDSVLATRGRKLYRGISAQYVTQVITLTPGVGEPIRRR